MSQQKKNKGALDPAIASEHLSQRMRMLSSLSTNSSIKQDRIGKQQLLLPSRGTSRMHETQPRNHPDTFTPTHNLSHVKTAPEQTLTSAYNRARHQKQSHNSPPTQTRPQASPAQISKTPQQTITSTYNGACPEKQSHDSLLTQTRPQASPTQTPKTSRKTLTQRSNRARPQKQSHNSLLTQTRPQASPTQTPQTAQETLTQRYNRACTQKESQTTLTQTHKLQRTQTALPGFSKQTHNPSHLQTLDRRSFSESIGQEQGPGFTHKSPSEPSVPFASAQVTTPEKESLIYKLLIKIDNRLSSFDKRLENLENIAQNIYQLTGRAAQKKRIAEKDRPTILPFSTKEDLLLFDNATNDEYNAFVDYLTYLGGGNVSAAAATYFKHCFQITEDLFSNLTWTGSTKYNIVSLKDTRFTAACEEALSNQGNLFSKPDNKEFTNVMTKALKSAKESFRRKRQAEAPVDESKPYKRRREEEKGRREEAFNNEDDNDDITLAAEEDIINADGEEMRNADEEEMRTVNEEETRDNDEEKMRNDDEEEIRNDDEEETRDTNEEDYCNEYGNDYDSGYHLDERRDSYEYETTDNNEYEYDRQNPINNEHNDHGNNYSLTDDNDDPILEYLISEQKKRKCSI